MFTTETADRDSQESAARGERRAAAAPPLELGRLADPGWIVATLWRRKGLILLCALAGFALAVLASLLIAPKYTSTAQLFIDPRDLRVLQNDVSPNTVGSDPTSIASYLESQARVIASDSIKTRVIEKLGLDKDPDYGGPARGGFLSGLFGADKAATERNALLYALAALDKSIAVHRGERTFVIDISATARDPERAAQIANSLAEAYLEDQAAVRADAAQRATAALTGRLEELRSRLRIAEDKAEKYKEAHNIVGLGGNRSLSEEQLSLNAAQLAAARQRTIEAKAKYDQIAATRPSSVEAGALPEAVASNTMTALRAQLGAALSKEADLVSSLGARHPALTAARSQVGDARRQIADELVRIARSAKAEYDRAVEAERQLSRRVDQLTTAQYAAGRAAVDLRELEREVESSRAVYDAFLKRARETGELGGIDTTNARVISPAMPPLEKSGVSRRTLALLGAFGGGGAGALLALAFALLAAARPVEARPAPSRGPLWRRKPRPVEAEAKVEAEEPVPPAPPEPAPMPESPPPAPPAPQPAERPEAAEQPVKAAAAETAAVAAASRSGWRRFVAIPGGQAARPAEKPALPQLGKIPAVRNRRWRREIEAPHSVFQAKAHLVDVVDKPQAGFASGIAALRAALSHGGGDDPRRNILVLGLQGQAGATTIALNLALDAALAGQPALLVDAGDGPLALTRIFAPDTQAGLEEVIGGSRTLARAVLKDEGSDLAFLPRSHRPDPAAPGSLAGALFGADRRYGPVIVDATAGSVLARRFAEAVDDILVVARHGRLTGAELERLRAQLGPAAAKLRGVVANEI
ncbi:exopolysaccharide transport family protein [Bosea minatitlanensis]|uniref:Exopolysaccharide transport family protein n=2 Tax=Bosea minatitlanensis TaxID=128782 RepID=A0ABW0F8U7_9HYPH